MSFNAIILAGGLGTRLRDAVPNVPKVLAPIADRPFLSYLLDRLSNAGCSCVVLAVGYRRELVRSAIGASHGSIRVIYSEEASPLGTGGAAAKAARLLDSAEVVLLNGDTYAELNYQAMIEQHCSTNSKITVAVMRVADVSRFGAVEVVNGRIVRFLEKGGRGPGLINAGIYVIDRSLLASLEYGAPLSLEKDILHRRTEELRPSAFLTDGIFIDIGVPDDYKAAAAMLRLA